MKFKKSCFWTGGGLSAAILAVMIVAAPAAESKSPLEAAREAARKAAAELKAVESKAAQAAAAEKAASEKKTAARTAAERAAAEKAAAEKALAQKVAAARTAAEKAAAAQKAADEAAKQKGEADKLLAEKGKVARAAEAKLLAEEAYHAQRALLSAESELVKQKKAVAQKAAAARKAAAVLEQARTAAQKARAEHQAAEKKVQETEASQQAAVEAKLKEKAAALKTATDKLAAAEKAGKKAAAEHQAAEKQLAESHAGLPGAKDRAATTHASAIGGLKPISSSQWDYDKARHLLFRAGFGGPPEEVESLLAKGLHGAVEYLVEYHGLPEPGAHFDPFPPERALPYEKLLASEERSKLSDERTRRERPQQARLRQWWLERMVETARPLEEKMVLFWHDHFSVNYREFYYTHLLYQQNQMFRGRKGDNFGALLRGIIHDAAMIRYLDNHRNFKGAGNENLGREILELFSMGEGQGYTEEDLREASRALTGYTYDHYSNSFRFLATRHDEGPKTIFGRKGNWGGDDLVDLILQQPATARYIALKLFSSFAHENPSPETVERLAHVLRGHQYDIKPYLKNLFLSEEFYSDASMGSHIKSPVELVVGTIRILGLEDVNYGRVDSTVQNMGMVLFEPPNVAGWEEGQTWINANRILDRYNGVAALIEQPSVDLVRAWADKKFESPAQVVDYAAQCFLATPLNAKKRAALIEYLEGLPPSAQWAKDSKGVNARLRAALVMMLSMPEYQVSQFPGRTPGILPWIAGLPAGIQSSFNRNPIVSEP